MNAKLNLLLALLFCLILQDGAAQSLFKGLEPLFTTPHGYQAAYASTAPVIDGDITDSVWDKAPWSQYFQDIEGDNKPLPPLNTRIKMLWNDTCIFICADLQEPEIWASLKNHDTMLYMDNDFEVFLDPDNNGLDYYELEVSPFNTVFDLLLTKPYRNTGNAIVAYDFPSLQTAVKINGTLNRPADHDAGWTVEIAIPLRGLDLPSSVVPGKKNVQWRLNFSRVEWNTTAEDGTYKKIKDRDGKDLPEHNYVWSPQGVINMHYPERWGYLTFTSGQADTSFVFPYAEKQKQYLWLTYYRQQEYFNKNHKYSTAIENFGIQKNIRIDGKANHIELEAGPHHYIAFIGDGSSMWSIDQDGHIKKEN